MPEKKIQGFKMYVVTGVPLFDAEKVKEFLDCCKKWADTVDPSIGMCRVTVTLEATDKTRRKKSAASRELESLTAEAAFRNGNVWKKKNYRFSFAEREYFWNGEPLYFTAGEEVFLFRWLVLGDTEYRREKRVYLCHIRKRIGKAFLEETDK